MSELDWSAHTVDEFRSQLKKLDMRLDSEMSEQQLNEVGQQLVELEIAIKRRGFFEQLHAELSQVQGKERKAHKL